MSKTLVVKNANFFDNRLDHIIYDVIHAESIILSTSEIVADMIGKTYTINYTITPSDAEDAILWESSDENVATVNANGIVTITGCGSCTITATAGSVSDTCDITVEIIINDITLAKTYILYPPTSENDITSSFSYLSSSKNLLTAVDVDPNEEKLFIDYSMMTGTDSGATLKPAESRPGFYKIYGWCIPIVLPDNCSKIRVTALDNTFGSIVLFYKSEVPSTLCGGNSVASRKPTVTWSGYNQANAPWNYGESYEYDVPSGYDSVSVTWRADVENSPFDNFNNATAEQLAAFKIICC